MIKSNTDVLYRNTLHLNKKEMIKVEKSTEFEENENENEKPGATGKTFRVTPETVKKFKSLSDEFGFKNQDTAMANFIAAFELQQARVMIPTRGKEIEEFAGFTKRLNEIFLNSLEVNVNTEAFVREEYSNKVETQISVINSQQEQILKSKENISELTAQLKESQKNTNDLEKSFKAAEATTATQSQLIAEYREKNEALSNIIAKNQAVLDDAEKVRNDFDKYKAKSEADKALAITTSEKAINDLEKKHEKQLADLSVEARKIELQYQSEIERINTRAEAALEKRSNQLQSDYQVQMQAEREKFNDRCEELQTKHQEREQSINEKHNDKIARLLQEMQQPQKQSEQNNKTPMESVVNDIKKQAPDLIKK